MIEVGIEEAQENWAALMEQVERGEVIGLLRGGVRVARLEPMSTPLSSPVRGQQSSLNSGDGPTKL